MKVIKNADGTMQTVPNNETDDQELLKRTRRELRDMLSGNTQFHEDEWAAPKKEPEQVNIYDYLFDLGKAE